MEISELLLLFVVGVIVFSILFSILSLKNRKLSKSAKILCSAKMKLKMGLKYNNITKYLPIVLYFIFWYFTLYKSHNEGDIIFFIFSTILIGLMFIFLHICNKYAKRRSKNCENSKNTNLTGNNPIEVIGFDDFVDVQITDKGIMLKNMIWKRWNYFKGYSKEGNHIILIPKYSWIEPYVYFLNNGGLENLIKNYLKEIK